MKLLNDIEFFNYENVNFILNYLKQNETIGIEETNPIEYFHCFWSSYPLSELHNMSLTSLINTNPLSKIILWTSNKLEILNSLSAINIQKKFKDKLEIIEINKSIFKEADAEFIYSYFNMLLYTKDQPSIAYASDILRFVVLQIYGGIWFDLDVYFLRNFNSIKINRYVSQWGIDPCGNAAIMRLEKGHNLINYIFIKNLKDHFIQQQHLN